MSTEDRESRYVALVFDDSSGRLEPRFIEMEDDQGPGIDMGTWHKRPDGLWEMHIATEYELLKKLVHFSDSTLELLTGIEKAREQIRQCNGTPEGVQALYTWLRAWVGCAVPALHRARVLVETLVIPMK